MPKVHGNPTAGFLISAIGSALGWALIVLAGKEVWHLVVH